MSGPIVRFIIKRQASSQSSPYWEEFDLHSRPGMNVIVGLMDIAANPVDRLGKPTTPVTYESNCLEEVCGSCAMLINGKAAMACSSLINKLEQQIAYSRDAWRSSSGRPRLSIRVCATAADSFIIENGWIVPRPSTTPWKRSKTVGLLQTNVLPFALRSTAFGASAFPGFVDGVCVT